MMREVCFVLTARADMRGNSVEILQHNRVCCKLKGTWMRLRPGALDVATLHGCWCDVTTKVFVPRIFSLEAVGRGPEFRCLDPSCAWARA